MHEQLNTEIWSRILGCASSGLVDHVGRVRLPLYRPAFFGGLILIDRARL